MHLLSLLFLIPFASGYLFTCLDDCECDTDDEVIHCHNGGRKELTLPMGQRLRGFPVIGLTYNNIVSLPNEATLLSRFPDLKMVDVERNPDFDCSTLENYNTIKIISDCFRNISDISRVPPLYRPSANCDFSCQASKHYDKLHEYVMKLWEIVKDKYQNFDWDTTLKQLQEFFSDLVNRVNRFGKDVHESIKPKYSEHPKSLAVDVPENDESN